jgi:putative restriction endonuclease
MAIKIIVAVTDGDWFDHLRHLPDLEEVNFWAPSGAPFRALERGEVFLFKLHAPNNFIVGGGVFFYANALPLSLAWQAFREANGARTLTEMRLRIMKYRRITADDQSDFTIGCRILTQPFFLDRQDWLAVPSSFARTIVSFKTYTTADSDGLALWEAVQPWLLQRGHPRGMDDKAAQYGAPTLIRPRLGQGAFRVLITDIYGRRCAVTGERTLPALDTAHIIPYSNGGLHEAKNGLLLRRDIHSLFDAGYVTVTPQHQFEVSRRIREEFENGRDYYALHGSHVRIPDKVEETPDPAALAWHNEHCFRG